MLITRTPASADRDRILQQIRRIRFADGLKCPRCYHRQIQKWGGFCGRRRFRCRGCFRTFSDLTGTPLAYTKRLASWRRFTVCLLAGASVRRTGRRLGIHKDTAWRWRHRLLDALRERQPEGFEGPVELREVTFLYSEKGSRRLKRPAFRGASRPHRLNRARVWALLARDSTARTMAEVAGPNRPDHEFVRQKLLMRCPPDTLVLSTGGRFSSIRRACRDATLRHRRVSPGRFSPALPRVSAVRDSIVGFELRMKSWLARFRGVATRYLQNYLCLHGFVEERRWKTVAVDLIERVAMLAANNSRRQNMMSPRRIPG